MQDEDRKKAMREISPYISLGMQFVTPVLMGVLGGYYLDKHYDTKPVWTLILALAGIAIGFYNFFKIVLKKDNNKNPKS